MVKYGYFSGCKYKLPDLNRVSAAMDVHTDKFSEVLGLSIYSVVKLVIPGIAWIFKFNIPYLSIVLLSNVHPYSLYYYHNLYISIKF